MRALDNLNHLERKRAVRECPTCGGWKHGTCAFCYPGDWATSESDEEFTELNTLRNGEE